MQPRGIWYLASEMSCHDNKRSYFRSYLFKFFTQNRTSRKLPRSASSAHFPNIPTTSYYLIFPFLGRGGGATAAIRGQNVVRGRGWSFFLVKLLIWRNDMIMCLKRGISNEILSFTRVKFNNCLLAILSIVAKKFSLNFLVFH